MKAKKLEKTIQGKQKLTMSVLGIVEGSKPEINQKITYGSCKSGHNTIKQLLS